MNRFSTPGGVSERVVFLSSIVIICGIVLLEVKSGPDIRPRILYVFSLTAIALHSERMPKVLLGFVLTVLFEVGALLRFQLPPGASFVDGFRCVAGLVLVTVLARIARRHYLKTLVLATRDPLTETHNRHSFDSIAELVLARQKRYGDVCSLAVIDLHGFKYLNDSLGHHAGIRH